MADRNQWKTRLGAVLPHEWIFGGYLLLTALRLFAVGGEARSWSYLFLGSLLGGVAVFFWAERNLTPWRWRVRLFILSGGDGRFVLCHGRGRAAAGPSQG